MKINSLVLVMLTILSMTTQAGKNFDCKLFLESIKESLEKCNQKQSQDEKLRCLLAVRDKVLLRATEYENYDAEEKETFIQAVKVAGEAFSSASFQEMDAQETNSSQE